jgi:hypothetical protein
MALMLWVLTCFFLEPVMVEKEVGTVKGERDKALTGADDSFQESTSMGGTLVASYDTLCQW